MQAAPQFTPSQLLDSGRRAESEGKFDLANHFYRHLTDHYAYTAEAAEARNGLGRLSATQSQIWQPANGIHINGGGSADASHRQRGRPGRRRPLAPRDHYRTGRAMARAFSALGWATAGLGVLSPALHFVPGLPAPMPGFGALVAGAVGLVISGLLVVFLGQVARALFDQANAARDLAALERAKLAAD